MSTTYSIDFENSTGIAGTYAVFNTPPNVSNDPTLEVFTNVWMSFKQPVGGTFDVSANVDYYAYCGTCPTTPAPGVTVSAGDSLPVTLGGPNGGGTSYAMIVNDGSPSFDPNSKSMEAPTGAFQIKTGQDFKSPNTTILVGMSIVGNNGIPEPAATILAEPGKTFDIVPQAVFYIAGCEQGRGTIVRWADYSSDAACIDFSSTEADGMTNATVIANNTGGFSVTFQS